MKESLSCFLASVDRTYAIPTGGNHKLLSAEEESLISEVEQLDLLPSEIMAHLSYGLNSYQCYSLVILGSRLAVLAVRSQSVRVFRTGMLFFLAGIIKIDRRDAFRVLAVVENCANRLGLMCQQELLKLAVTDGDCECQALLKAFFSRTDDMRSIDVMGITKTGDDSTLAFW